MRMYLYGTIFHELTHMCVCVYRSNHMVVCKRHSIWKHVKYGISAIFKNDFFLIFFHFIFICSILTQFEVIKSIVIDVSYENGFNVKVSEMLKFKNSPKIEKC